LTGSAPFSSYDPFRDNSEYAHELAVFVALVEAGVIEVVGSGIDNIRCLAPARGEYPSVWHQYQQLSRTGSVAFLSRNLLKSPVEVLESVFNEWSDGKVTFVNAPNKVMFYCQSEKYESLRDSILLEFDEKLRKREVSFERFASIIESSNPEEAVYSNLGI
jgi:hypothetical protein